MAKLPALPTGKELLGSRPPGFLDSYGLKAVVGIADDGSAVVIAGQDQPLVGLATIHSDGRFQVNASAITTATIPYVNRFLEGTGKEVRLNWRSKNDPTVPQYYLTKSGRKQRRSKAAPTKSVAAIAATPMTVRVATPQVVSSFVEPKAATITVAAKNAPSGHALANIPGMRMPPSVLPKAKGAGQGYTAIEGIVFTNDAIREFMDCKAFADMPVERTRPLVGLLISGPAGTAKTTMAEVMAEHLGLPSLIVEGQSIRTADDWYGGLKPVGDRFEFRWSPMAQALRTGEPFMLIIDELTRSESVAALNGLMGLISPAAKATVTDAGTDISLPQGVMVVATANIGPEFVGTLPIDGAIRGRFPNGIRADFPTPGVEATILANLTGITKETAKQFVDAAVSQRTNRDAFPSGNILSTRTLIQAGHKVTHRNHTPREAMISVMRGQFDPQDDPALITLIDAHFPKTQVASPPAAGNEATITIGGAKHRFTGLSGDPCRFVFPGTGQTCGMDIHDLTIHWPN